MAEAATATAYEEQRRRQVEANQRKLEELELHRLSAAVREAAAAARHSQVKKPKQRAPLDAVKEPLRRSGRLATRERKISRTYVTPEERSHAISKAEDLVQQLGSSFPLFIKPMTHTMSLLYIPRHFWKYLPKDDEMITMVDEDDNESGTLYLATNKYLSAGWSGFVNRHRLVYGDCLVFQLIQRTKFKVCIIRASS